MRPATEWKGMKPIRPLPLSDIREKDLQFLIDRARERIRPDTVGDSSLELSDVTLVGHCLLSAKTQSDDYRRNNRLLVVYSGTVSSRYFDPVTTYFTIEFEGLVNLPNEEFLYTRESGIRGRTRATPHNAKHAKM